MKSKALASALLFVIIFGSGTIYAQSSSLSAVETTAVNKVGDFKYKPEAETKQVVSVFNIAPLQDLLRYNLLVKIESDINENGSYRIYGPTGLLVANKTIAVQKGFSIVMLDDKGSRAAGPYVIEVTTPTRTARTRVMRIN